MKRYVKKQILSLMDTMNEALDFVEKHIGEKSEVTEQLLEDCQLCAVQIGATVKESNDKADDIIYRLEEYREMIHQLSNSMADETYSQNLIKGIRKNVDQIANGIKNDIRTEIEVLFLPYKASMWTSLESIWKAASDDIDCKAVVMPIPYFTISDASKVSEVYEGDKFPKNVPITDYRTYDIEKVHPDIIFIHNPYDDKNNLLSVHPNYYTSKIKNYTDCLVYSPYFTYGSYIPEKSDFQYVVPGVINADKVIVQSEKVKQIFCTYGFNESKFVVSGSPKIDAIVNLNEKDLDIPKEWKDKLCNKKVFLLNTHLSYFPASFSNKTKSGNYGVRFHNEILKAIVDKKDVGLIWRPHPLLKNMITDRFPECLDYIQYFEKTLLESSNCVIDSLGDYRPAFYYSDALISTWSSLINEYMVLGKPVMIFQRQLSDEARLRAPIDRGINYFRFGPNGISFDKFIEMVKAGEDPLYEKRMETIRQAFVNMDGTAGYNAYMKIKSKILL